MSKKQKKFDHYRHKLIKFKNQTKKSINFIDEFFNLFRTIVQILIFLFLYFDQKNDNDHRNQKLMIHNNVTKKTKKQRVDIILYSA